ncbi:MAG TPA: LytTR family DNA-binding domain-containing protein [Polyangiaceae bacterium]|nr:LytTR family DNA-binding domain-containing protein [Polyangiaceae bacterium]
MARETKFTVIVVEDELASRERLKGLLARHHALIELIGEAENGPEAVELCMKCKPDLLFLDVSLPGFDGFDVLNQIPPGTRAIFTTAHEQHAVKAFRSNAVDYLLKPIDPQQLAEALARVEVELDKQSNSNIVRLLCRDRDQTEIVEVSRVLFLEAEDGYTHVQTQDKVYLSNEPLATLEGQLIETFARIHRKTLVNLTHVSALRHRDGDLFAIIGGKYELPVSRRHQQEFRRRLAYD